MMNKKLILISSLVLGILCWAGLAMAQFNHPYNTNGQTVVNVPAVGSITYFDNGGQFGNYSANSNNANTSIRFQPTTAGAKVQVVFTAFATEANFDALYVYDGQTTASPIIASGNGAPIGGPFPAGPAGGWWGNGLGNSPNNVAPNTVRATPGNASGALTFTFRSDFSVQLAGWQATVTEFIGCNPVPGPAVNVSTDPGICTATLNLTFPTFNPGGCGNATGFSVRYQLDANPFVNIAQPYPANVVIPFVTAGAHVITWQVLNASNAVIGQGTQEVFVADNEAPTLNCPSDIIINLNPGLCCAIVSWAEPTATDNCPFVGPVMMHQQTVPINSGWTGFANNIQNISAEPMMVTGIKIRAGVASGPQGPYNFRVYLRDGTFQTAGFMNNIAGWTEAANNTFNVNAGFFFPSMGADIVIPFTTPYELAPGASAAIYYVANNGAGLNVRVMYSTGATTTNDGNVLVTSGGGINGLFGGIAFQPRSAHLRVDYQLGGEAVVIQTGGPLSGEELCYEDSPWVVSYETEDSQGNVGECSFTIEVNNYANPKSDLSCNDNVQISLGEDCDTRVGADDILEGGPYSCYDDYIVTVMGPNGQPLPSSPFVGNAQIGNCYTVKVTDPSTGNSCWGSICVEDKMPPVMVCTDLEVACGQEIPLAPSPAFFAAQAPLQYPISFANHGGGQVFSLSGNTQPGGVYFNVTNNSAQSLQVTGFGIRFGNPAFGMVNPPQTMQVYTKAGTYAGFETNAAAWFNMGPQTITEIPPYFATGTGPLAQLPIAATQTLAPGETRAFHVFGATACPIFNYFGGTAPVTNGPFTVAGGPIAFGLFGPLFQAGAASMPNIQINWAVQLDAVPVTDNCTPNLYMNTIGQGLSYGDDIINYTCAENLEFYRTITRVWTATDQQGNSTQCIQTIDIKRASVASLDLPPNFDDIDEASFDCTGGYPTPEYINLNRGFGGYPAGGGCGSLQFEYWDKVLQVCQGSYTIIRTWKIHDMCTGDIAEVDQVVKVSDTTPPVLFCPEEHDIKVMGTKKVGYQECTARVLMPWIQVTDDCSTTNNITFYVWTTLQNGSVVIVNTMNSQGQYEFNIPVGFTYTFTYTAIDHCGNKAECEVEVEVRDLVPPVVICETFHTVALSDSITFVNAISFDDGSYDDCSAVTFDARRGTMNAAGNFVQHPCNLPGDFLYAPQVRFYCCDAQSSVELFVDLRVRDAAGNINNCMVPVIIVDKVRPVIWCPEDITVQCGMPYHPTDRDTFDICKQPNMQIKDAFAAVYTFPIDIFGIPADAKITDLDLSLDIEHALTNQLRITLYSPLNRKAEVLTPNSCVGQPVQFPWNIDVTFNDQAYNINVFNSTGQKVAAPFTCTSAKPSIGAFNQGQMKPQGDELKIFNGQPLNSFTNKFLCYTASTNDINAATNRISNFQVQAFILNAGLIAGDRILMEYASATGQNIVGLEVGSVYLFQVINNNTIELLTVTGADIISVPAGTQHMFCASGTWLLVVEDTAPLAGGIVNEFCLHIEYELPTGLKPHVTDNTEECGLTVTHQDLGTPDNCADGTFINRRWRVDDAFNNNTTCIQRVYFTDDTPLTVQFPCDVTVDCDDLDDLEATGEVLHNGDCEIVGVEYQDHVLVTTDACYKILRTWIVKDWCTFQPDGNIDYPTTSIDTDLNTITFSTALNALINSRRIDIGDRVTLRYVTSGTTEIPGMVEGDIYSMVRVSGTTFRVDYNTTKQQAVNITGQGVGPHIFRYANSDLGLPITCDVLVEWYPFVDWYTACCNPIAARRAWENDGDGHFKFVQEIKVIDEEAPQWVDCSDKEFCSFEADCGPTQIELICPATDNCTPADQLKYTYFIDAFNDGTVDITGTGNDASGAYPLGTHKITFKVTDQCGNWNTCTKLFTISDCKKPTPICINGLSVDLMAMNGGGMAEIWAKSLEAGDSHDNCTEYENLIILVERFSAITPGQEVPGAGASDVIQVTCDDIPPASPSPTVEVVVWVGDEAGNWDYCITTIWVQDNMGVCVPGMSTSLMTYVANEVQEGVELVDVNLSGDANAKIVSDNAGQAAFMTGLTTGMNVTLSPAKDINPLNGVSTYDLLLIQKHLLGVKMLNSPYKLIAADVNKSASITISDIIELRKMILTPGLNFSNNTSWRFVEQGYTFANPNKPYDFNETKAMTLALQGNTANFIGMKIGDVSGDHTPNTLLGGEVRNSVGTLSFSVADQTLKAGQEYQVAITAADFRNIQGYQYTMDFNTEVIEFVNVEANWADLSASNFGRAKVSEGVLTTSWNSSEGVTLNDGEVLYTVTFRAKAEMKLSQALTVNSRITKAEAYDQNEDLLEVNFRFDGGIVAGGEFALYQNEPNPFRDVTIIGFNLPESTKATLRVMDVTGKVVKVVSGDFAKGYNTINLTRGDIQGNGMLYYTLETTTDSATKRMILVD